MINVTAVILCGGEGTRLKSLFPDTPKCIVPVDGEPFLKYLIAQLSNKQEVSKIVLLASDKANQITQTVWPDQHYVYLEREFDIHLINFGNWRTIEIVKDPPKLGTAMGLWHSLQYVSSYPVLVMNGDTYCDFDFDEFLKFHTENRNDISILVSDVSDNNKFNFVDTGIWLMNKRCFDWEFFPTINITREKHFLKFGKTLKIEEFETKEFMIDIGTPDGYKKAEETFNKICPVCLRSNV